MPKPSIFYLGRDDTDTTATFSINGTRWEYHLTKPALESVDHLKRISLGKALAFAKRRAIKSERITP